MRTPLQYIRLCLVTASLTLLVVGCGSDDKPSNSRANNTNNKNNQNNQNNVSDMGAFVGVVNCSEDSDCDDGLACTTDTCIDAPEGKVCAWLVAEDTCLIERRCFDDGAANPGDACGACDPEMSQFAWSTAEDGAVCDDGDPCTFNTACSAGACVGDAVDCDDGNSCTIDTCTSGVGCTYEDENDGSSCDDGTACTENDVCTAGTCVGETLDCDDQNTCTQDSCDPTLGCTNEPLDDGTACEDGTFCTVGETCLAGLCQGAQPNTCDDFNACTIDICDERAGCQHLPTNNPCCTGQTSICDDQDPCTTDLCDPNTAECTYQLNTAPCDDGSACTENDACNQGTCTGSAINCDDGNSCTQDMCNVAAGCFYANLDAVACDDGQACSTGDMCMQGTCVADTSQCFCVPSFDDAARVNTLTVGANTMQGEALDIDGDNTRDNALAPLGSFVNGPLQDAANDGSLNLLFEYIGFAPGAFTLGLVTASVDPANASCDYTMNTCDYLADRSVLDPIACTTTIQLPANRTGTLVTAGGVGSQLPFSIPLDASNSLNITLYNVKVEMTVTLTNGQVSAFTAIIGGAATETDLNAAINSLDPASLPLPPANLINLLSTLAPNDIDTDGDGTDDAKSIGLKISGIDGNLVGAAP